MRAERAAMLRRWSDGLPSAEAVWSELEADYGGEDGLLECAVFTEYARQAVRWQSEGREAEISRLLENTEVLLQEAEWCRDHDLRGLVSTCFLESVQNLSLNGLADYATFEQQLGARSRVCWEEIEQLWEGEGMVAPHLIEAAAKAVASLIAAPIRFWGWLAKGREG